MKAYMRRRIYFKLNSEASFRWEEIRQQKQGQLQVLDLRDLEMNPPRSGVELGWVRFRSDH